MSSAATFSIVVSLSQPRGPRNAYPVPHGRREVQLPSTSAFVAFRLGRLARTMGNQPPVYEPESP